MTEPDGLKLLIEALSEDGHGQNLARAFEILDDRFTTLQAEVRYQREQTELQNEMIDMLMAYLSLSDQMFSVFLHSLNDERYATLIKWGEQRLNKFQQESGEHN